MILMKVNNVICSKQCDPEMTCVTGQDRLETMKEIPKRAEQATEKVNHKNIS